MAIINFINFKKYKKNKVKTIKLTLLYFIFFKVNKPPKSNFTFFYIMKKKNLGIFLTSKLEKIIIMRFL